MKAREGLEYDPQMTPGARGGAIPQFTPDDDTQCKFQELRELLWRDGGGVPGGEALSFCLASCCRFGKCDALKIRSFGGL